MDAGDKYVAALEALIALLETARCTFWPEFLRQDADLWKVQRDVSHHLKAYGGMGSFNDVILCPDNQHSVTREQEPWVNALFEALKASAYGLARQVEEGHVAKTPLVEFVSEGGPGAQLTSLLCRACNACYVTSRNVHRAAARRWADTVVPETIEQGRVGELPSKAFAFSSDPDARRHLEDIQRAVDETRLKQLPDGFNQYEEPCPKCEDSSWWIHYWEILEAPLRLEELPPPYQA